MPTPKPRPIPAHIADILPAIAAAVAATLVFSGALRYFFAQDDFAGLARAAGLAPRLAGPWRYLSGQTYFDLMRVAAGLNATAYHAVSLLLHALAAAAVAALLGRFVSRPAALIGGVFFATHAALFTAVYSVSGIGEILAALFALFMLLALLRNDRWRWGAVPAFALALLSKESVLLLPCVAMFARPRGDLGTTPRRIDAVLWTLAGIAAAYVAWYFAADTFGVRRGLPETAPYRLDFGAAVVQNLLTYAGWTLDFSFWGVRRFTDSVDTSVHLQGLAFLAILIAGCFVRPLRARGWLAAVAYFALALAPVLPLANHTYHYYLDTALPGAAWALAALFDLLVAARKPPASDVAAYSMPLACGVAVLLALNGYQLVNKIETHPFAEGRRADATVDRALIAANVRDDLGVASLPPGIRLRFWSPTAQQRAQPGADSNTETYWEHNVRTALLDGLGVRVLFPQIAEARFVRRLEPTPDSVGWAVYRIDGHLGIASYAQLDAMIRAHGGAP